MLETIYHFEQIAARFNAIVLIGAGVFCVFVGLFAWLGGLGFRKPLVAIAGAVGCGVCAFFTTSRSIIFAMAVAAAGAIIALAFERTFITILTVSLVVVFSCAVLARPYIEEGREATLTERPEILYQAEPFTVRQTIVTMKVYIADFSFEIKRACLQMPVYNWGIIAALAAIFIAAGFFLWRLTSALCCAALGTLLIFAGMILLLLYKAAMPLSHIYNRTSFYTIVAIAMTISGTIEQLLLCPRSKKHSATKKGANKDKEEVVETTLDWRGK